MSSVLEIPPTNTLPSPMELENLYRLGTKSVMNVSEVNSDNQAAIYVSGMTPQDAGEFVSYIMNGCRQIPEPDLEIDPVTKKRINIVEFGLIYGVEVKYPDRISVYLHLTSGRCGKRNDIEGAVQEVLTQASAAAKEALGQPFREILVDSRNPLTPKWSNDSVSHTCRVCVDRVSMLRNHERSG